MKTAELTGAALDWAVAIAAKMTVEIQPAGKCGRPLYVLAAEQGCTPWIWNPSESWHQGGPIIDRLFKQGLRLHTAEYMTGVHNKELLVASLDSPNGFWFGPTPLIAAMRCYVASKLGDEVEVPDELIKENQS